MWKNEDESGLHKGKRLFYYIFYVCYLCVLVSGAVQSDNKNESIFLASLSIASAVGLVRLIYIFEKNEEITAFLQYVGLHSFTEREEFIKIKKTMTYFTYISNFLFSVLISGLFTPSISVLPVFSNKKRLPLFLDSLFPINSEISYWLAFIFIQCGLFISMVATSTVLHMWYLLINVSIKYQLMGNKFQNLGLTRRKKLQVPWKWNEIHFFKIWLN